MNSTNGCRKGSRPTATALARTPHATLALATAAAKKAEAFRAASKAPATLRAYGSAWRAFTAWCKRHRAFPLPAFPATVAAYLADRAAPAKGRPLKPSTLQVHAAAIVKAHRLAGHASPLENEHVKDTLAGIRRQLGTAPVQKDALTIEQIRALVGTCDDGPKGLRDRALILVGFASALRRSELVGLDVDDVVDTAEGLVVTLGRSKTDQEGKGYALGVCYGSNPTTCPVRAWRVWLEASGLEDGPTFRPIDRHGNVKGARLTDQAVARMLKARGEQAGLDPSGISGHSLRAGHVTEATRNGAATHDVRQQTRHKSDAMLGRYIRRATLFERNSSARLGL